MGTFASVWPGVNVDSGTVVIVAEHLGEERTVSRRGGTAYDRARDYVGVATKIFGGAVHHHVNPQIQGRLIRRRSKSRQRTKSGILAHNRFEDSRIP